MKASQTRMSFKGNDVAFRMSRHGSNEVRIFMGKYCTFVPFDGSIRAGRDDQSLAGTQTAHLICVNLYEQEGKWKGKVAYVGF